jgi:hypothetical protein
MNNTLKQLEQDRHVLNEENAEQNSLRQSKRTDIKEEHFGLICSKIT